jgi:hypothetical protein
MTDTEARVSLFALRSPVRVFLGSSETHADPESAIAPTNQTPVVHSFSWYSRYFCGLREFKNPSSWLCVRILVPLLKHPLVVSEPINGSFNGLTNSQL